MVRARALVRAFVNSFRTPLTELVLTVGFCVLLSVLVFAGGGFGSLTSYFLVWALFPFM